MNDIYKQIAPVFEDFHKSTFKQNRSRQPRVYTAGPMQFDKNMGAGWRRTVERKLIKSGFSVFNPASKDKLKWELGMFKECTKKDYDVDKVKDWSYNIILKDIYELVHCDIVLCRWIHNTISTGTPSELTIAKLFNIPVLMVFPKDIKLLPLWVLGTITECVKDFKDVDKKLMRILKERE